MKTVLLGFGNPYLCDDAVGVRLAEDFRMVLENTPDLDIVEECSVGGLDVLDLLRGYDRAIVLDSIQTAGGVPGSWYHFGADALRETLHLTNIHDVNLATALELGRRSGLPLPQDIHIFAVEVQETRTFSETMTPAVEARYGDCAAEILQAVRVALE